MNKWLFHQNGFTRTSLPATVTGVKALSNYNVLANVCRRMKNISNTLAYAEIELKNQRKPLSELIQSVC